MMAQHRAPEPIRKIPAQQRRQFAFLGLILGGVFGGLALMGTLSPVAVPSFVRAEATVPAVITPRLTFIFPAPRLAADTVNRGRAAGKDDRVSARAALGADFPGTSSSPREVAEHAKSGDARRPHHPEYRSRHRSPKHHHKTGHHHG